LKNFIIRDLIQKMYEFIWLVDILKETLNKFPKD
jgi:hypothetical protein